MRENREDQKGMEGIRMWSWEGQRSEKQRGRQGREKEEKMEEECKEGKLTLAALNL